MPKRTASEDAFDFTNEANAMADSLFGPANRRVKPRVVQAAATADDDSSGAEEGHHHKSRAQPDPAIQIPAQLRRYAAALSQWNDPKALMFRNAIIQASTSRRDAIVAAGRDSMNMSTSFPISAENSFTTSYGPGGAWREMMDESMDTTFEKLAPFFGLPTRPVPKNPHLSNQVDIYDLPEAYAGNNRYISQTLFYQMVKTDLTLLRFGMPVVRNDSTAKIVMVQHIYEPALLGRLPYESAPRLVVARKAIREYMSMRMGLGAISEWGFWNHEEGKRDWLYKQDQIAYANQRTLALYAVVALLHCMKVPTKVEEARSQPYDITSWREVIKHELDMWNMIVVHKDGLQMAADTAREEMDNRHVSVNESRLMFVIPHGAEKFAVLDPSRRNYQETGVPKLVYDDPNSLRLRGVGHLHVSRPFMIGAGERPQDPMFRLRAIGYMWNTTGVPHCTSLTQVLTPSVGCGDIRAHFEEPSDDFQNMSNKKLFDYSGLYKTYPADTPAAGVKYGEGIDGLSVNIIRTYLNKSDDKKIAGTATLHQLFSGPNADISRADLVARITLVVIKLNTGDATVMAALNAATGGGAGGGGGLGAASDLAAIKAWFHATTVYSDDGSGHAHKFLLWCFTYGVPVPLRFAPLAPHVRYRCGQAILLVGGGEAGVTMAGNPDATVGMNPKTKLVSLSFSINLGAHVLNPEKVVTLANAFVQRYHSGCKFDSWMDPSNKTLVDRYKSGGERVDDTRNLFSILCPPDWTPKFAIARTGSEGLSYTKSKEALCPTMAAYATFYNWRAQEYDQFSYHHKNPVQSEAPLCFQQLQFNHSIGADNKIVQWGAVTADKGHWQNSITDSSCLKYRCGQVPVPPNFVPMWQRTQQRVMVTM